MTSQIYNNINMHNINMKKLKYTKIFFIEYENNNEQMYE